MPINITKKSFTKIVSTIKNNINNKFNFINSVKKVDNTGSQFNIGEYFGSAKVGTIKYFMEGCENILSKEKPNLSDFNKDNPQVASKNNSEIESKHNSININKHNSEVKSKNNSEAESKNNSEVKSKNNSEAESKNNSEIKSKHNSININKHNSEVKSENNSEVENKHNSEIESKNNSEVKSENNSEVKIENNLEVKVESNSEVKSENNSEVKSKHNSEVKSKHNSEIESKNNSEVKSENNSEVKSKHNSEVESKNNSEVKSKHNSEIESKNNSEVKSENDSEIENKHNSINANENNLETVDRGNNGALAFMNPVYEYPEIENITKNPIKQEENNNELLSWLLDSGKQKLNVNESLYFKSEKKRSVKNFFKILISPFKFIERSITPIRINTINLNINNEVDNFLINNESDKKEISENFNQRLKQLNTTFSDNINDVINKKNLNRTEMDGLIKYHTLEKALECKFINDIRKLKDEFTTDLAKDNLKKNYSKLPSEILEKINDMLNDKTKVSKKMSDYEKINFLFSYERINELKVFVKGEINSEHKDIDFDNIINKTFDSVMNIKNKEEIERSNDNFDNVKEELYLDLTKELFNNLLKSKKIYGEDAFVSQIDNLIKLTSENISKKMLDKENKIINYLDKSFYKNINKGDKGNDLLTRIFKNSSNNINYKWAQDAIILLMSYETFGIYNNETTSYTSNGVRSIGGSGSENIEKTVAENKLAGVFNRLGLDTNNLDKSKDEVLRKYFANYF